jgi:hypothetical protein
MKNSISGHLTGALTPFRIWAFGFLFLFVINISWESANNLPPSWDMAHHQLMGLQFFEAFSTGNILEGYTGLTTYYPPLYYLSEALVLLLFGDTQLLALLSNFIGLFLLSFFTFRTAEKFMPPPSAVVAGLVVLMLPMVAWTSRVSLLDTGLAGWVIFAFYLVFKSNYFENRGYTILFGLACAAGILHKWTFPFFLVFTVIHILTFTRSRKKVILNLCLAGVAAIPLAATWYLPNALSLWERIRMTAEAGTQFENDPGLASVWGWIYYVRCLSGYYLFLPLTLLFIIAVCRLSRDLKKTRLLQLAAVNLAGSVLILTILDMKDPRYIMPAAPFMIILLMAGWKDYPVWSRAVIPGICFLQFLAVSFTAPGIPEKIALFEVENDTSYKGMNYEWVFFETDYFDILGRARHENWRLEEMMNYFSDGENVAVIPEHPYYNPTTFNLFARKRGYLNLGLPRLGLNEFLPEQLERVDWIVGKSGPQGVNFLTMFNRDIYAHLAKEKWPVSIIMSLPDGSKARIWKNPGN